MGTTDYIEFQHREATVLVDVLRWAVDTDDLEEHIHDTPSMTGSFDPDITESVIERVQDEHELALENVPPSDLQVLMKAFAHALQDQAWDIDDTGPVFEFYEDTFSEIEQAVEQQA